jgi:hypothetical protein
VYRCCQHNVAFGWPYYAENLWVASAGNGLAALLYAPCTVQAYVGDTGAQATIEEQTDYPFGDTVEFRLTLSEPAQFPLLLRVPGWCEGASLEINGRRQTVEAHPPSFITVERAWRSGDRVTLHLPMRVTTTTWKKQRDAVSVHRGPLSYSLKIGQRWEKIGGTDEWPELAVYPTTPWNVGLVVHPSNLAASIRVVEKRAVAPQPFDLEAAPVELRGTGRILPEWKLVENGADAPPPSPVSAPGPDREITLVPMGCARLRVSVFPRVG